MLPPVDQARGLGTRPLPPLELKGMDFHGSNGLQSPLVKEFGQVVVIEPLKGVAFGSLQAPGVEVAGRSNIMDRPANQDALVVAARQGEIVAVVVDGMGGHNGGDIASRIVCDVHIASLELGVDMQVDEILFQANDAMLAFKHIINMSVQDRIHTPQTQIPLDQLYRNLGSVINEGFPHFTLDDSGKQGATETAFLSLAQQYAISRALIAAFDHSNLYDVTAQTHADLLKPDADSQAIFSSLLTDDRFQYCREYIGLLRSLTEMGAAAAAWSLSGQTLRFTKVGDCGVLCYRPGLPMQERVYFRSFHDNHANMLSVKGLVVNERQLRRSRKLLCAPLGDAVSLTRVSPGTNPAELRLMLDNDLRYVEPLQLEVQPDDIVIAFTDGLEGVPPEEIIKLLDNSVLAHADADKIAMQLHDVVTKVPGTERDNVAFTVMRVLSN